MISIRVPKETRNIGKAQGYHGLSISDRTYDCSVNGPETPMMVTHWRPTEKELEALQAGAVVELCITGQQHPPLRVGVWPEENS